MTIGERREYRRDVVAAEDDRCADAQRPRGLAPTIVEDRLCGIDLGERALAALVVRLPLLGEGLFTGRAVKEARAEPPLQSRDRLGNRGARDAHALGSQRKAPGVRRLHEDVDSLHAII